MATSSLMRFSEPLRRKIPSTLVAGKDVRIYEISYSSEEQTLFLQINTTFRNYDRYISVDIAFAFEIYQRDCDVRIWNALAQWYSKYSRTRFDRYANVSILHFSNCFRPTSYFTIALRTLLELSPP